MTGHFAGCVRNFIEAIITAKTIQENIIPLTANTDEVEPEWKDKLNITLGSAQYKEVNYAMSMPLVLWAHLLLLF